MRSPFTVEEGKDCKNDNHDWWLWNTYGCWSRPFSSGREELDTVGRRDTCLTSEYHLGKGGVCDASTEISTPLISVELPRKVRGGLHREPN